MCFVLKYFHGQYADSNTREILMNIQNKCVNVLFPTLFTVEKSCPQPSFKYNISNDVISRQKQRTELSITVKSALLTAIHLG